MTQPHAQQDHAEGEPALPLHGVYHHGEADRRDTYPDTYRDNDTRAGPDLESSPSTSCRGKVAGIVVVVGLLLLIIAVHLTGTLGPGLRGRGHP